MNEIKDKIAIIGFGASGFGTYLGLKEKGFKKVGNWNGGLEGAYSIQIYKFCKSELAYDHICKRYQLNGC